MVKEFRIIFNRPSTQRTGVPSVLSGSEVSGTVLVRVEESKKYKCLKIFLKGKGHVSWSTNEQRTTYHQSEKYVNFVQVLWDKSHSPDPGQMLPAGVHRFPFQFTLPTSIPSSFEGNGGWIRYYLKAKIFAGSFKLVNKHTIKIPELPVTEVINVNTPELVRPLRLERQKTTGCFLCVSGPVTMTVELPRTGYCVGEEIPFQVTVENGSNRRVECFAQLQQHRLYSVQSSVYNHQRYDPIVLLVTLRGPPIEAHTTSTWVPEDRALTVPTNIPVIINTKIIKRYFHLNMVIVIPNEKNLEIPIPVTIGNVPYHQEAQPLPVTIDNVPEHQEVQPIRYSAHAHSLAPGIEAIASAPRSELTWDQPPSYEDAVAVY